MDNVAGPSRPLTIAGYGGFVLIGWNVVLLPSLIRSVEHDFHQTDAAFGLLFFIGSLVYGLGASGGGFLTERVGRRAVLCGGAGALAVGYGGEALAPGWIALLAASVPLNWGAGVIDSGMNGLFLDLYRDARGGALNLLHLFFSLGALIAPFIIGQLLAAGTPWRAIVLATGLAAVPLLIALYLTGMPSGRHTHATATDARDDAAAESSLRPFVGLALSIGLYVAAEVAVSNWMVRYLAGVPVATATAVLSIFWAGLTLGRLLSNWLAERIDYFAFTIGCSVLAALALVGAVLSAWLPLSAALYGLTGMFFGPIYPMIMALGGNIYPRRLAALSGGLAASAVAGGMIYPPLMGLFAAQVGLRTGLLGAAGLSIPTVLGLLFGRATASRDTRQATAGSGSARHSAR